jgi:cytidine deaminase
MTKILAQTMRRAWARYDSPLPEAFFGQPDWLALWQLREHLVLRAIGSAAERGRSYRDFCVGTAAFVTSTDPDLLRSLGRPAHALYTGANLKLGPEERNTCAEQEIVAQIRQQTHMFPPREILALVVAGEAQDEPDAESGVHTTTLHPCRHCRRLLMATPEMRPTTLIVTVNLSNTYQEVHTFQEILKVHGLAFPPSRRSPS